MASLTSASAPRATSDALWAALAALALLCLHAAAGFPTIVNANGDNDSLLRLVEVHDLIGGQGWFDLMQYRMGLDGGFLMHWSRLVDAPIALILLAARAVTSDQALADTITLALWPTLLLAAALWLLMRLARSLGGETVLFPVLVIGAVTLRSMGIFNPGAVDHHNVQLVLALATMALMIEVQASLARAIGAGACAALMIGVGMETAPYVAVAGLIMALWFLVDSRAARPAGAFGIGFGGVAAAIFLATVPSTGWLVARCDAFSIAQFAVAALAGIGLTIVCAVTAKGSRLQRGAGLVLLGIALAALVAAAFPQCLADPYTGVDTRLRTYWLDSVSEAQPLWSILAHKPGIATTYYATPLLALVLASASVRKRISWPAIVVGAFLVASVLVSIWQVRGAMFSVPFAVLPLAVWVARRRSVSAASGTTGATLKTIGAWLVSFSISWTAAFAAISIATEDAGAAAEAAAMPADCQTAGDYAALGALPATRVLASSNLGAPILRHTGHSVFAGPYHRNNAGNLVAIEAFMDPLPQAEAAIRAKRVTLLAFCPGNSESSALAGWAPGALMARLVTGDFPAWLQPVPGTEHQPLVLYRVLPR